MDFDTEINGLPNDNYFTSWNLMLDSAKTIAESMLCESLDGHHVYGAFQPASCEIAVKVQPEQFRSDPNSKYFTYMQMDVMADHGNYDPEISDIPYCDWSYTSGMYSGIITTENLEAPFTKEELGGTIVESVKAAAELKAYHEAAGGEEGVVEDLFCNMWDLEDIELAPVTPVTSENFNARALASVGKTHHTLMGHSVDNARIKVSFDNYTKKTFPEDSAVDWARILTSLKYTGLLSSIYDGNIRDYLMKNGITAYFAPPVNSAPLIPKHSLIVPKLNLVKTGGLEILKESLQSASLVLSSEDVASVVLKRAIEAKELTSDYNELAEQFMLSAEKLAFDSLVKSRMKQIVQVSGGFEVISTNLMWRTEDDVFKSYKLKSTLSPNKVIKEVFRVRLKEVLKLYPKFLEIFLDYYNFKKITSFEDTIQLTKELWTLITQEPFVSTMQTFWLSQQPDIRKVNLVILERLSAIVSNSINIGTKWPLQVGIIRCISEPYFILSYLKSTLSEEVKTMTEPPDYPHEANIVKSVVSLSEAAVVYFNKLRVLWKERYDLQTKRFQLLDPKDHNVIRYQSLSKAFETIDYDTLMKTNETFIYPMKEELTALYLIFKNFMRKRSLTYDRKQLSPHSHLKDLGLKMDLLLPSNFQITITFESLGQLIYERYKMLHMDIKTYISAPGDPINTDYENFDHKYQALEEKINDLKRKDEEEKARKKELINASVMSFGSFNLGDIFANAMSNQSIDPFLEAMSTYDTDELADYYATVWGYKDFKEWFDAEGSSVKYSEDKEVEMYAKLINKRLENQVISEEDNEDYEVS